jgi:hypothetical protein
LSSGVELTSTVGERPYCGVTGVGAGGWFTRLTTHPGTFALAEVHRQHGTDLHTVRAALHALRSPDSHTHDPGPEPQPEPEDTATIRWRQLRRQAEQIADGWAAELPPDQRRRIITAGQAVPLRRAIAGLHALLDHGWTPTRLADQLAAREQRTVLTDAAVLDHRVHQLLNADHLDARAHLLPAARTRRQDWHHTTRLLHAAELNHLATHPTSQLAAERRTLTRQPTTTPDDRSRAAGRLDLLDAALARQLDHAALHLTAQPPGYLTALLGRRPSHPGAAAVWDRQALAVEHYRHHVLGIAYGSPAARPTASAVQQALGAPPANPGYHARYQQLTALQATLDLGAQL